MPTHPACCTPMHHCKSPPKTHAHCTHLAPPRSHTSTSHALPATATCAGYSVIKVTSTSGQRGKSPLCQLMTAATLATSPPFYNADPNFECGTKKQLQPDPPPGGGGGPSGLPTPTACVSVVAANGSVVNFCAERNETATTCVVILFDTCLHRCGAARVSSDSSTLTLPP
jgi:hypothetical protein